jgi:hypothetical protein
MLYFYFLHSVHIDGVIPFPYPHQVLSFVLGIFGAFFQAACDCRYIYESVLHTIIFRILIQINSMFSFVKILHGILVNSPCSFVFSCAYLGHALDLSQRRCNAAQDRIMLLSILQSQERQSRLDTEQLPVPFQAMHELVETAH